MNEAHGTGEVYSLSASSARKYGVTIGCTVPKCNFKTWFTCQWEGEGDDEKPVGIKYARCIIRSHPVPIHGEKDGVVAQLTRSKKKKNWGEGRKSSVDPEESKAVKPKIKMKKLNFSEPGTDIELEKLNEKYRPKRLKKPNPSFGQ